MVNKHKTVDMQNAQGSNDKQRTVVACLVVLVAVLGLSALVIYLMLVPPTHTGRVDAEKVEQFDITNHTTHVISQFVVEEIMDDGAHIIHIAHMRDAPGTADQGGVTQGGVTQGDTQGSASTASESETELLHSSAPPSSRCCGFLGNRGHWTARNMPVRIYQAPHLVPHFETIDKAWAAAAGGVDLVGPILQSSASFTYTHSRIDWMNGINSVTFSRINWPDGIPLAITSLYFETGLKQHIVHNSNYFDLLSIAMHEMGHGYGLADLRSSSCDTTLMYESLMRGSTRGRSIDFETTRCVQELYSDLPIEGETALDVNSGNTMHSIPAALLLIATSLQMC
jgi:hypothetical protein